MSRPLSHETFLLRTLEVGRQVYNDVIKEKTHHYIGETIHAYGYTGKVVGIYPFYLLCESKSGYKFAVSYADIVTHNTKWNINDQRGRK